MARVVKIRATPSFAAPIIGTFRAGQSLRLASPARAAEPAETVSCAGGWYAVKPRGHVCAGARATIDASRANERPWSQALPRPSEAYPYRYGHARGSPRYLRLPTKAEQHRSEPGLAGHLAEQSRAARQLSAPPPSDVLMQQLGRSPQLRHELDAYPGMKLAWALEFAAMGRAWLLTSEAALVPKDKVTPMQPVQTMSAHPGAATVPAFPFAMVLDRTARTGPDDSSSTASWPRGALVPITAAPQRRAASRFLDVRGGGRIRAAATALFDRSARPAGVTMQDKWVHVRVNEGTLVAYEGDRPVFAAAVSPGVHGVSPGPLRTPPGRYRVSSKAITADMSGEVAGGNWRTRDVPWVAYYDGSHALHGAWWHDRFGRPRSHGCINLSPADARWLFRWLDPQLPAGWHAVRASPPGRAGTLIVIQR